MARLAAAIRSALRYMPATPSTVEQIIAEKNAWWGGISLSPRTCGEARPPDRVTSLLLPPRRSAPGAVRRLGRRAEAGGIARKRRAPSLRRRRRTARRPRRRLAVRTASQCEARLDPRRRPQRSSPAGAG